MRLAPWVGWLLCLGSGTAAILAHFSWVLVFLGAASGLILSWLGRAFLAARRRRADFFSGQSERVTRAADEEVDLGQVPSNYRILALVGVGDFAGARRALLASSDSSCHDTREIRLCARILIEAFEGEARQALSLCRDLLQGAGSPDARTLARRESVISIARILAGLGDEEDWEGLERTPTFEPALLWACRYAAVHRREEASLETHPIFESAPRWPRESYFFWLQHRLTERAGYRRRALSVA